MDRLIADLSVRATMDVFCARREPATDKEAWLKSVLDELIDPVQAAKRTTGMIVKVREVSAASGEIMIICGGAHVSRLADALPGARIVRGEFFF